MFNITNISFRERVICILYLTGLLHWYFFINYGSPSFHAFDWVCIHQWLDVIRQALLTKTIPYHASYYLNEYLTGHYVWGDRFFATPYIIASPHVLLMSFMSVPAFMTLQLMFIYSIGFLGIYRWIRKFNLSATASVFLLILCCFNGAIVARMGVGHLQLASYMLIPYFLWLLYKFIEHEHADNKIKLIISIQYAFFLLFCLLQGANHTVYQMVLIGMLVVLFYPKQILWYILSLFIFGILASYYIWPNLLFGAYMCRTDRVVFCGYGIQSGASGIHKIRIGGLFVIPINILHHIWEGLTIAYNASNDATWEYNLYISAFGLMLVIAATIIAVIKYKDKMNIRNVRFIFPAIIVTIASCHCIARIPFSFLQHFVPLPAIDRLPSRLLMYPFFLILIISSIGFDNIFFILPGKIRSAIKWMVILVLFCILMFHSFGWSVAQTEQHFNNNVIRDLVTQQFKTVIYNRQGDLQYKKIVLISYLISFFCVIFCATIYRYIKKDISNCLEKTRKRA